DRIEEGRNLLTRMPKLEAQQSMRKAYQKLADDKIDLAAFTKERARILDSVKTSEAEGAKFAVTILEAIAIIQENYFKEVNVGNFSGIGVQIRKNNTRDMLQVVTPLMGSPAYKAKMYAGDVITTIVREVDSEGNPPQVPEVISTKGMTTEDAVKKITGKAGTK